MKQQTSAATETGNKGRNIIDFSGKTIYVGIDVHQKDWQIAIRCGEVTLANFRMLAGAQCLIDHLQSRYQGAIIKCVYESCAWGFELQRRLTKAGIDCIVVHAADIGSTDKEKKRKTDKVDALKLANNLGSGNLKGIHVPDEGLQKQRSLIRLRHSLKRDLTRSKNRLKSLFKFQGIELPKQFEKNNWSHNFLSWIEEQSHQDALLEDTICLMLDQIKHLRELLLRAERKLRLVMQDDRYRDQIKLVSSAPGIGTVNAAMFALEVGDIRRFKNFDSLNDFVGFCPDSDSTGETQRHTGITSRRHNELRRCLIQAAWQCIKKDPAMLEAYQQLRKRMSDHKAVVRIARKLLRRIRRVLLTGIPYQIGVVN